MLKFQANPQAEDTGPQRDIRLDVLARCREETRVPIGAVLAEQRAFPLTFGSTDRQIVRFVARHRVAQPGGVGYRDALARGEAARLIVHAAHVAHPDLREGLVLLEDPVVTG